MEERKVKNLLKNRIVIGLICIILSLIICFGLTPMFNNALKSKVSLVLPQLVNAAKVSTT